MGGVLLSTPARANGTPITIVLSYLEGVSNWGPTNATGVAELVTREGEVHLKTTGLPRLTGEEYDVWIVNTNSQQRLSLGRFNSADDGRGALDVAGAREIPDSGWNLMMLSVEATGTASTAPSNRHTIAGRFPNPSDPQARPGTLPRTGGSEDEPWRLWLGIAVLAAVAFAAGGFVATRRARRNTP
jgi:LPXTG-motif cell wall-anchored protein